MLTDNQLIKRYKIKSGDRILDIGGSMKQHQKLPIDTLVDIIRPENAPYTPTKLKAKKYVKCDISSEKLPFKNNEFDFCLCTHTLEDLNHPFLALEEMGRVSERGYVATPSFGKDITFSHINYTDWLTGARRIPGNAHHKWLFLKEGGTLVVVPKSYALLYTSEFQVVDWIGEEELEYYWENKIKYKKVDDLDFHKLIKFYRNFYFKNEKNIVKGRPLLYIDSPLYFVKEKLKLFLKRGRGFSK